MSLSVYVHIPFCASKCAYCAFYSAAASDETREKYVDALVNQIENSPEKGAKITSVFFGGGTPSILSPKQLFRVYDALFGHFDLSGAEVTTELNPDSVSALLAPELKGVFTRLSMGVQSFDDGELRTLRRRHTASEAIAAYEKLRAAGAENINIDLMLALPGEGHLDVLKKTLKTAVSLAPEHVSAYILTPEKGTPLYEKYGLFNDQIAPDAYLLTCETLENAGYGHYEISNFALPGKRCVHNMCYWSQEKYLAFGAQACGFDGKKRYKNDCTTKEFIEKNGLIEPTVEENMEDDALKKEKTMLSLRLSDGIDKNTLDLLMADKRKNVVISRLIPEMAYINERGGLSLTDEGFLVSNEIIRELVYE